MPQESQGPANAPSPLTAWDGAPGVRDSLHPEGGGEWNAALAEIFTASVSVEQGRESGGRISGFQPGSMSIFRLGLEPQSLAVRPDNSGNSNLTMGILETGRISFTCHTTQLDLGPGDIFVTPRWDAYSLVADGPVKLTVIQAPIWWLLGRGPSADSTGWIGAQHLRIPSDFFLSPVLLSAVSALLRHDGVAEHIDQAGYLLRAAMIHTLNAAAPAPQLTFRVRSRFAHLHSYIMLNISSEDLSPKTTAEALKVSLRTLHQTCADRGTTFSSLVLDMRIGYAAYLLRSGAESVSEVAFATGFRSLSHFCRLFKQTYGVSARRYRLAAPDPASL